MGKFLFLKVNNRAEPTQRHSAKWFTFDVAFDLCNNPAELLSPFNDREDALTWPWLYV